MSNSEHGERLATIEEKVKALEKESEKMKSVLDDLTRKIYMALGGFALVSVAIQLYSALKH